MIVGTGIDLCEISRIRQVVQRHGERFLQRVYTPAELAYCQEKQRGAMQSLAARFAAKEAAAKALGTGIAKDVGWLDMEVVSYRGDRPTLRFAGRAAEWAAHLEVDAIHLSLSHSLDLAVASVILERHGQR